MTLEPRATAASGPHDGLGAILAPRSIAVIGASRREHAMGHQIMRNLVRFGFTGAVHPVNPSARAVCSVRAAPNVRSIGEPIDLAVVVVPRDHAADVVQEAGEAGVRGVVVITAGFRESGPAGRAAEEALSRIACAHGMRMVGPNCMGVINADPRISMNATFADVMPPHGHAAFVSQSGALGLNVLDHASEYGIGISQFVSVGNKPDVSGNDLLEVWEHDPATRVILMYVENFGNPRRFLELAKRISRVKPIIAVKSGRSLAGARAAASHTGALAASDEAVDAMLTQAGVVRAATIEELFELAAGFEARARPRGRATAVLTNAGGPGILAADALEAHGLRLVELEAATVAAVRPLFPPEASIRNPLDMIASATPEGYRTALTALLADPGVHAVVPIFVPPFGVRQEEVAQAIAGAAATAPDKPIVAVLMGREGLSQGRAELQAVGIPSYAFPESAARALASLNRQVERGRREPGGTPQLGGIDAACAGAIVNRAVAEGRRALGQVEALAMLDAYGIPTAPARAASTVDEAIAAATAIGYPIVLKVLSPDIVHKTDVAGVRRGIDSDAALRAAMIGLLADVARLAPAARIDGVIVQQAVVPGRELILGMTRDPHFGPIVMVGLGGVFVEALRDVSFRIAPLTDADADEMIDGLRGARMLGAFRGMPPVDRASLVSALHRLSRLTAEFPSIAELDINPLVASSTGVVALDARVGLADATP